MRFLQAVWKIIEKQFAKIGYAITSASWGIARPPQPATLANVVSNGREQNTQDEHFIDKDEETE